MARIFYPTSGLCTCHKRILDQAKAYIAKHFHVVNVVGQQSVGKSQTMAALAKSLSDERLVAWWNCYSPFDIVTLIRMALAQAAKPDIDARVYDKFGKGLAKLEMMTDDLKREALIWFLNDLSPVLFFDDFDNISSDPHVLTVLSSAIDRAQHGCIVVISRTNIQDKLRTQKIIPVLGRTANDWHVSEKDAIDELNAPPDLRTFLGHDPYLPRDVAQLLAAAELQKETNHELDRELLSRNPSGALTAYFYDYIQEKETHGRVLDWLLDLSVLRGPRPLEMLWALRDSRGVLSVTADRILKVLTSAQLLLAETHDGTPLAQGVGGKFDMANAFSDFLQSRQDATRIQGAHESVAAEYARRLRELRDHYHGDHRPGPLTAALLDIGEAISHYVSANQADQAWSLLKDLQEDIEELGEIRLVYMWMSQLVSQLKNKDLHNPHLDLCRLACKMTRPQELRLHLQNAIGAQKPVPDPEDMAEVRFYQSIDALYQSDLLRSWRFLGLALQDGAQISPELRADILLRRCRVAMMRACPADFLAAMRDVLAGLTSGHIHPKPEFFNFLYSCVAEYYNQMGLSNRAVAWANKAASHGSATAFRRALSAYWVGRCQVGLVDLLERQKDRIEQELSSHGPSIKAADSPRVKDLDTQIGVYSGAAVENARKAAQEFDEAGSRDIWWGMEIQKCLAYAYKVNRAWPEAGKALEAAYAFDADQQCPRNRIHLDLLKARLAIAQMVERKWQGVEEVRQATMSLLDNLAEQLKKKMAFPFELAQVYELRAPLGGNAFNDFVRAMMTYQDLGLIYCVGRCCESILTRFDCQVAVKREPVISLLATVLSPDSFVENGCTVANDPIEAIHSVLDGPVPQRWGNLLLSHPARFLITSLLPVAVDASMNELQSIEARRANPHPHTQEDIAYVARTETEFLASVRTLCQGLENKFGGTPRPCPWLRSSERLPCKKWQCQLLCDNKPFPACTYDISEWGLLLAVNMNGDASRFDKPGKPITIQILSGPKPLRTNLVLRGKTVQHVHDPKPYFELATSPDVPYRMGLPVHLEDNLRDALKDCGCFQHDTCRSGICVHAW